MAAMTEQTCNCGRPTVGAWLCDQCQTTLRWALVNVAAYAGDLENVARKQTRYGSGGAKGSVGKVQPLVVDGRFTERTDQGSQLRDDTRATVVAWCRTVMEDQPELAGPACVDCLHISCSAVRRRRYPKDTVASMVAYLARQFRLVMSEQWAPDFLDEMLDLERRLARFVDRPAERWYAGKCSTMTMGDPDSPSVGTCGVELYASADRGTITCTGCGAVHDVAERRAVLLSEAKDYHVTATEAAAALIAWTDYDGTEKKLIDRIAYWRDQDELEVADVASLHGRDRHLYRLGDLQALLIEHAQRGQRRRISTAAAS